MKDKIKSKFFLCITVILLCAMQMIPVYANADKMLVDHEGGEGENPIMRVEKLQEADRKEKGSIQIELTEGRTGTSKENVEFSCTKIGEIEKGEYRLKEEFLSSDVDLNTIHSAKDMEEAAKQLAELNVSAEYKQLTDKNGKLCFRDLPVGVYFLEATNTANYEKVTPCLISIPTFDEKEGEMVYDIQVLPKHEPEPGRITTSSPPVSPQTGLDSPILKYFLGVMGIAALLFVLNYKTKKQRKKK